jgi:hypothetical protein
MADPEDFRTPDADLIRLSFDDPDQFALIFERHADALHRYLAKRSNHSSVDDLVSEMFIRDLLAEGNGSKGKSRRSIFLPVSGSEALCETWSGT